MRRGSNEDVKFIRNLTVDWSDQEGDYVYVLTKLAEYHNGERELAGTVSGNKKWASRIAKHYGIPVPKVEE